MNSEDTLRSEAQEEDYSSGFPYQFYNTQHQSRQFTQEATTKYQTELLKP